MKMISERMIRCPQSWNFCCGLGGLGFGDVWVVSADVTWRVAPSFRDHL